MTKTPAGEPLEPTETEAELARLETDLDQLRALAPGWQIWRGVNLIIYAWRTRSSPQILSRTRTVAGALPFIRDKDQASARRFAGLRA